MAKKVLVYDSGGIFTHIAEALSSYFDDVFYYTPWDRSLPKSVECLPGYGLDEITRVNDFFVYLKEVKTVVFCDVGNPGLQEFLREEGKHVFGCGSAAAFERDRSLLHKEAKRHKIPMADSMSLIGIENLRKALKLIPECYVKISYFRGDMETFHHHSKSLTAVWLSDLQSRMGPAGELAEFVIEMPIDAEESVEVGIDTFCAEGRFPENMAWGYEVKDNAFLGFSTPLPKRIVNHVQRYLPLLRTYRGAISDETKYTDSEEFLLDLTCRFPSPPSEIEAVWIDNLGEVIEGVAQGEIVEPEYKTKFAAQIVLYSDWGEEHPVEVDMSKVDSGYVLLHGHAKINGVDYAVANDSIIGAAVGIGDSVAQAVEQAISAASSIEAYQLTYDVSSLEKAVEEAKKGDKLLGGKYGEESRTVSGR